MECVLLELYISVSNSLNQKISHISKSFLKAQKCDAIFAFKMVELVYDTVSFSFFRQFK